jgi:O-antigen/teichoic acid export membrane protein
MPSSLAKIRHRLAGDHGSLGRNSLWLMSTTVINSALGYGYWLIVARRFAPASVGLAAGLIALMTITSLASNLGTASALVQRLPLRSTVQEWSTTLSASLLGGAAFAILAGLLVLLALAQLSPTLAVARHSVGLAALFLCGTAFWTVSTVLDYTFIAQRTSRAMTSRNAIFGVTKIPLVLVAPLLVGAHAGVTAIFASWVIACAISCALAIGFIVPRLRPGARLRLSGALTELRAMTRLLAGNYFITLGNVLPAYLLPIIVVSRLSATDNAFFYITWLVGGVFFMVSSAIAFSLFAEGSNEPRQLRRLTISSVRLTTTLLLPAMLFMLLAGRLILSVFGARYASSGIALLLILTAAAIPDAITNICAAVLRVEGRLAVGGMLTCGMAAIAAIGAWVVAPLDGLAGIGLAWLASQMIGSAWVLWDRVFSRRARALRSSPIAGITISG